MAQDQRGPESPEFEVASIKLLEPNVPREMGVKVYPGGRVVISGFSLRNLIATAFQLSYWQISGGENWTQNDEYIVEAKPEESVGSTIKDLRYTVFSIENERLRQMLQGLLAARFQLRFHRETKTGDVYVLERSGKTLRLRPAEVRQAASGRGLFGSIGYAGARWTISASTMAQLAKFASDFVLHAPVVDRTKLEGAFDYRQSLPDSEPNYSDPSDSFLPFMAEVGLRLKKSNGPVEMLVIDHAEKAGGN